MTSSNYTPVLPSNYVTCESGFIRIPKKLKLTPPKRRLYNVGLNNAGYKVRPVIGNQKTICPIYSKWANMLKRCYSESSLSARPTYQGCSVSQEWLDFTAFRLWVEDQNWVGLALDKDIIVQGNKIYSPETCVFIPKSINNLLIDHRNARGDLPLGVSMNRYQYSASLNIDGVEEYIGSFATKEEARRSYLLAKADNIERMTLTEGLDIRAIDGLLRIAASMRE